MFKAFTSETLCYFNELFRNAFGYRLPLVWCMKLSKTCTHNFNYLCFKHGCITELVRKMMTSCMSVSKAVKVTVLACKLTILSCSVVVALNNINIDRVLGVNCVNSNVST